MDLFIKPISFDQKFLFLHRCAIVGSSLAEEILLENEGIFLLLDLLEVFSYLPNAHK